MSKKKKVSQKDKDRKYLEINGKRIRFLSSKASIYKNSSIIILKGKFSTMLAKKKPKLLEFLSRAPISFEEE